MSTGCRGYSAYERARKHSGFTLIELLVVVAIIGMLASVVLASLGSVRESAQDTRALADLRQLTLALELYYDDNETYPLGGSGYLSHDEEGGLAPAADVLAPEYIREIPIHPGTALGGQRNYYYWFQIAHITEGYVLRTRLHDIPDGCIIVVGLSDDQLTSSMQSYPSCHASDGA